MRVDGLYIPELIADEVTTSYSGRTVVDIKKVEGTESATTPTPAPSNPTLTVLWVGVFTSIAGLALQTIRFMSEKKED